MKLPHLRSLLAVAETGSFTAAAAELRLTQSGVSQGVAALEDALRVALVVRHRRGAVLTAAGARVAGHARAAFAALDQIRAVSEDARTLAGGQVRLAAFPSVFSTLLPPLLRRFGSAYPGIRVTALETDDTEVENWLAAGQVDLGVVLNPPPGRAATILGRDAWVPIWPAAHRFARRSTLPLAELVTEPFVLATGGCRTNALSIAHAAGLCLPDVRMEVRDWASAIALVRDGAGLALVPASTVPENRRGLRVSALTEPVHRVFGLVAAPGKVTSPASRAFIEVAELASSGGDARPPDPADGHTAASGPSRRRAGA